MYNEDLEILRAKRLLESKGYFISRIDEMATSWKDIKVTLMSEKTREVILHLLKIYYWGDITTSKSHWMKEVHTFLNSIHLLKSTKKYPETSKIFTAIWDAWGDTWDAIEKTLNTEEKYKKLPRIKVDEVAIQYCKDYLMWVCNELSFSGTVSNSEVSGKLVELYKKYRGD